MQGATLPQTSSEQRIQKYEKILAKLYDICTQEIKSKERQEQLGFEYKKLVEEFHNGSRGAEFETKLVTFARSVETIAFAESLDTKVYPNNIQQTACYQPHQQQSTSPKSWYEIEKGLHAQQSPPQSYKQQTVSQSQAEQKKEIYSNGLVLLAEKGIPTIKSEERRAQLVFEYNKLLEEFYAGYHDSEFDTKFRALIKSVDTEIAQQETAQEPQYLQPQQQIPIVESRPVQVPQQNYQRDQQPVWLQVEHPQQEIPVVESEPVQPIQQQPAQPKQTQESQLQKAKAVQIPIGTESYISSLIQKKAGCVKGIGDNYKHILEIDYRLGCEQNLLNNLESRLSLSRAGCPIGVGVGVAVGSFTCLIAMASQYFIYNSIYSFLGTFVASGASVFGAIGYVTGKKKEEKIKNQLAEKQKTVNAVKLYKQSCIGKMNSLQNEIRILEKEIDNSIPDLQVKAEFPEGLIEETYAPVDLVVLNTGKGPAYDVECSIKGPIDGESEAKFNLVENKKVSKRLSLKPTARGKMRWVYEIKCKDHLKREYVGEVDQWIDSATFKPAPAVQIGQQIIGDVHGDVAGRDIDKSDKSTVSMIKDSVVSRTSVGGKKED